MKAWTTYYVEGETPERKELEAALCAKRFEGIEIDAGKSSATGWAYYQDGEPLPAENADINKLFPTPHTAFAFRKEEITVPHAAWTREKKKRIEALDHEPSSEEERAIQEDVIAILRRRAIPEVTVVPVLVDGHTRRLYVGQCPAGLREEIEDALQALRLHGVIQSPFAALALEDHDGPVDRECEAAAGLYPVDFSEEA